MKIPDVVNDNHKDDFIRRARAVWQPRLGRDLSREDTRQITANMTGFFCVLAEWSRAELSAPANDSATPDASMTGEARHDR
jgi:hypothetical protein